MSRLPLLLPPLLLVTAACAPPAPATERDRLAVVTTTGMIRDLVENVGGDRVHVVALMGPGVDPHLYRASEGDVRRLFRADVVFYNGLHLEARMGDVIERMGARTRVRAVSDAVPAERLSSPPEFEGAVDPHIWFDVGLWAYALGAVVETLAAADPPGAAGYRERGRAYRGVLEALDAYVREQAARVPAERRVLVTAHDAFHYFGAAYGFEVRGLQGISTAGEAGTADVQSLAAFIVARRIPAVFVESSVPVRAIRAVQEAVRARRWTVHVGGSLFSDAMGSPGTPEGTYPGMVRHNIDTIVGALLGQPEERG
jgi:manganese/zinc/iron transport system substrate-binding protein